jgi:hypothetical protein
VEQSDPGKKSGMLLWILQAMVIVGALLSGRTTRRLPVGVDAQDLAHGYERSDIRPGLVLVGAAGLLLVMAVVVVAVTMFETNVTGIAPRIGSPDELSQGLQGGPAPTSPVPRLEAQAGESLGPYLAAQRQKLSTYRWVDRQAGVVAIPIERAMDLVADQGLPARPAPAEMGNRAPSGSSSGRVDQAYP